MGRVVGCTVQQYQEFWIKDFLRWATVIKCFFGIKRRTALPFLKGGN